MPTLTLRQIQILTDALLRFKVQRDARLAAEQRLSDAFGHAVTLDLENNQEDKNLVAEVAA
jgi:hypothetical protein